MSSTLSKRWLSVLALMGIASGGLLPAPHLHSANGGAIVHVHGGEAAAAHDGDRDHHDQRVFDHGDHTTAQTLDRSFDFAARFVLSFDLIDEPASPDAALRIRTRLMRSRILPTHDPPLRFTSAPSPPPVV